jgi:hypothetical protein
VRKPEPVMRTTSLSTRQPSLGQPDTDVTVNGDTIAKMTKRTAALVSLRETGSLHRTGDDKEEERQKEREGNHLGLRGGC